MKFKQIIFSFIFFTFALSSCTEDNDGENLYPEVKSEFSFALDHLNSTVKINNNSTGADTYLWDFGDGNTSTETNPTHQYSADGTYTIRLTSTNVVGDKNTVTHEIILDINNVCSAENKQTISFSNLAITFKNNPNFVSDGVNYEVITNPIIAETNNSCKVARAQRTLTHPYVNLQLSLDKKFDFSENSGFKMKVLSPVEGAKIVVKLEDATVGSIFSEVVKTSTIANEWEELEFYFGEDKSGKYDKMVIFFDLGAENEKTFYFDDLIMTSIAAPSTELKFPITFENSALNYEFINFGNASSSKVENPHSTRDNTSNYVGKFNKTNGAETWAGSFLTMTNPINLDKNKVKIKVWSPKKDATVLLKLENLNNNAVFFESSSTTTKANEWEELTFDISSIDKTKTYQKVILFFDFGNVGDDSSYYFDDLIQE